MGSVVVCELVINMNKIDRRDFMKLTAAGVALPLMIQRSDPAPEINLKELAEGEAKHSEKIDLSGGGMYDLFITVETANPSPEEVYFYLGHPEVEDVAKMIFIGSTRLEKGNGVLHTRIFIPNANFKLVVDPKVPAKLVASPMEAVIYD